MKWGVLIFILFSFINNGTNLTASSYTEEIVKALRLSTVELMTQGGDDRLHLNATTQMNKYFTSPIALSLEIARSSCTSSRPTMGAYGAAEKLHLNFLSQAADDRQDMFDVVADDIRTRIKKAFVNDALKNVHIVCTASGSDAEMLFTLLALLRHPADFSSGGPYVCNVIVASSEVGSGTADAARACHFSNYTPLGPLVKKGSNVSGISPSAVQIVSLKTRDQINGYVCPKEMLEESISKTVEQAVVEGKIAVVHMVHSSKTGAGTPSFHFMKKLKKKYKDKIVVVVDVAQGRCSDGYITTLLSHDFCVLITGSKFFAGVPFCGAVLIPDCEAAVFKDITSLPIGLQDYFSAYEVDKTLEGLRSGCSKKPNIGSLLRWESALYEIERYFSLDKVMREKVIQQWASSVGRMLKNTVACIPLEMVANHTLLAEEDSIAGQCNTVISFFVRRPGVDGDFFSVEQLRKIHELLASDISNLLPDEASEQDRITAKQKCLIGQPVNILGNSGVLRVALSAPMVSKMVVECQYASMDQVLERVLQEDQTVFSKIALIVHYYERLMY